MIKTSQNNNPIQCVFVLLARNRTGTKWLIFIMKISYKHGKIAEKDWKEIKIKKLFMMMKKLVWRTRIRRRRRCQQSNEIFKYNDCKVVGCIKEYRK